MQIIRIGTDTRAELQACLYKTLPYTALRLNMGLHMTRCRNCSIATVPSKWDPRAGAFESPLFNSMQFT